MDLESDSLPRPDRIQAVLAEYVSRRASGELLSDEDILSDHADLRPELELELQKMRVINAAFDAFDAPTPPFGLHSTERTDPPAQLGIRCPACKSLVDIASSEALEQVTCGACDTTFRLIVHDQPEVVDLSGTTIAHFQLRSLLGEGAFGSVWRAHDRQLDRDVAIKLPRRGQLTEQESEFFLREARAAAQLAHPHIVRIHEVGRDENRLYIVSELIEGGTLAEQLRQLPFSVKATAEVCRTIASALQAAHEAGVVHRDLKPSNVLMDRSGRPHVSDFGLAKRSSGELTMTTAGQMLGTPAYMSPEQARGASHQADARSDIYSLGVILFEMLTGELPFRGTPQMLVYQVVHDEPPRVRQLNQLVPKDLETICLKCLEKQPDRRYTEAKHMAEDLDRWLRHEPIAARPLSHVGRATRWCQRKPVVASLLGTVLAVTLIGLAGVTWQWRATKAALVREQQQRARADDNLRTAGDVVDEFLKSVASLRLAHEPNVQQLRNELLTKATKYYETIASTNADDPVLRFEKAKALRSLAHLKGDVGDVAAGLKYANAALEILDSLQDAPEVDPDQRHAEVAATLIARGAMNATSAMDREVEGSPEDDFGAAHQVLQQPLSHQPDNLMWLRYDANALARLGSLFRTLHHPEAIATIEEAILAWERIIERDPQQPSFYDQLGRSHLDLALVYLESGPYERAGDHAQQSLQLQQQGLAFDEDYWPCHSTLAFSFATLGRVQSLLRDFDAAVASFEQAIATREVVAEAFPESVYHRNNLANQVHRLAGLHLSHHRAEAAWPLIEREIALRTEMCGELPDNAAMRRNLVGALMNRCDILQLEEKFDDVLATTNEAFAILADQEPGMWSDDAIAIIHSRAAAAQLGLQQYSAALESCDRSRALLEPLVQARPNDIRFAQRLLNLRWSIVEIWQAAGEIEKALGITDAVLEYAREMSVRFSHEPEATLAYSSCLVGIGQIHQQAEDWPAAEERLLQAITVQPLQFAANPEETNAITATAALVETYLKQGRWDDAVAFMDCLVTAADTDAVACGAAAVLAQVLTTVDADADLISDQRDDFLAQQTARAVDLCAGALDDERARPWMRQLEAFAYLRDHSARFRELLDLDRET